MGKNRANKKQFYTENPAQLKREMVWLFSRMKEHRGRITVIALLGLMGTLMSLASGVASKYLVDAVAGRQLQSVLTAAVVMAVLLLGGLGLQSLSSRISASVHIRVKRQLQHAAYGRILRAAWQTLERHQSGDLLSRLNSDAGTVADGIISFVPGAVMSAIRFLGAFCVMLYYDPVMALIALVGAPVTLLMSRVLLRKLRGHDLTMKELTGRVMSFQEDSLGNLTSIKAFGAAKAYQNEMDQLQGEYQEAYLSYNSFRIGVSACLSMTSLLVTAACLGWGVYRLYIGEITYGSLVLFLQMAAMLRSAFSSLVSLMQQSVSIMTSAGRVMEVEQLPEENSAVPPGFKEERELVVSLQQVKFRYQTGDEVLDTFGFYAKPGEMIAVTGASGEGKTTLLRLLLGLVEPCEGRAELIGVTGNPYRIVAGTRSAFSYVPQGSSIFAGTIAYNLRIVAPEATDSQLRSALETACAWDFVQQLPGGLDHILGSGGRGISEGQAQRLAIARALLRKAPVLLLDEATSALDADTERQLLENLQRSGLVRTCILVTHREAAAKVCTRTYNIENGRVEQLNEKE